MEDDNSISWSARINALFWIMRPLNATTAAVAVIVAIHLAYGIASPSINPRDFLFISSAAFFVTAHSMSHNDIVDFEIDKVNAPHRPLPSGILTMKQAKIWAITLAILAITSGLLIDLTLDIFPFSVFWAILNMVILDLYNSRLKRSGLLGNMIIGYVSAALFIYADIIINQSLTIGTESIALYAFFLIWGREVLKDVIDIEGDRLHNIQTIPVRLGRNTGVLVGSIIIFIGILSSLPLIISPVDGKLIIPLILSGLNLVVIGLLVKVNLDSQDDVIYSSKLWLLRMLLIALLVLATNQLVTIYF